MIEDLDETIKEMLRVEVPLNLSEVDISFDVPNREWSQSISKPTINVYLHDIRENFDLKSGEWEIERGKDGRFNKNKPGRRIDLSYLITAWTTDVEDEHHLIWDVLATMLRFQVIPERLLQGRLRSQRAPVQTKTAQPDGILRNVSDVWTALDNQLKPVLTYSVTVAMDNQMLQGNIPEVRTRFLRFYPPNNENISQLVTAAPTNGSLSTYTEIGGFVTAAANPSEAVHRAEVVLVEQGLTATSDVQGRFKFSNIVQRPKYTFLVVAAGYETLRQELTIPAASYDFQLQPQILASPNGASMLKV